MTPYLEVDANDPHPSLPEVGAFESDRPGQAPQELSAEMIALESLVHHRGSLPHDLPLEDVHRIFREQALDYLALIRDGRVTGICSRARIGFVLGSRFGLLGIRNVRFQLI